MAPPSVFRYVIVSEAIPLERLLSPQSQRPWLPLDSPSSVDDGGNSRYQGDINPATTIALGLQSQFLSFRFGQKR